MNKIYTFKLEYQDRKTKENKNFIYKVQAVLDTNNYEYRIFNLSQRTVWKDYSFKTLQEANNFLENHPNNVKKRGR